MKNKRKNILVTGGAGYIGAVLIPLLLHEGYTVTVFDTFYFGKKPILSFSKRVRVVVGDVRNPPKDLFKNIHSVIHLAALSNDPTAEFNPIANMEINMGGAKKIAEMAKRAGVRRFVFASSCSIYDCGLITKTMTRKETSGVFPKNPYSLSKYLAEQEILKFTSTTFIPVILRKGTVFGYSPRMRYDLIINTMVRDALWSGTLHVFSEGKQWRPLVSVEDVAHAYVLALKAPTSLVKGKIINIAAGNYQVDFIAKKVRGVFKEIFNRSITIVYENDSRTDRSYKVSMNRARKLLGFSPAHTIESSIQSLVKHISNNTTLQNFEDPLFYNIKRMKPILEKMTTLSSRRKSMF